MKPEIILNKDCPIFFAQLALISHLSFLALGMLFGKIEPFWAQSELNSMFGI